MNRELTTSQDSIFNFVLVPALKSQIVVAQWNFEFKLVMMIAFTTEK